MTETATPPPTLTQKVSAEALGTFVLVFFGVGAAMAIDVVSVAGVALAFGISVLVMAYAVGHISGGHFNPAVSVGAAMAGRLSWVQAAIYAAAQIVGAIVAALVLFIVYTGIDGWDADGSMGQNFFGDQSPFGTDIALWSALIVEIVATAIFLYVILAATDKRNPSAAAAPVAIGLSLAGIHLALIPLTGTSVNPARSIGPALFAGTDSIMQLWLFIVAPLVGAMIAGFTYAFIFGSDGDPVAGSGLNLGSSHPHTTGFAGGWDPNAPAPGTYDPNTDQWNHPVQQGAPQQQHWGQPAPEQHWGNPGHAQQQWGQPEQSQQPQQPLQSNQQWTQSGQTPEQQFQAKQPQQTGPGPEPSDAPAGDDTGHTHIRPSQDDRPSP